MLMCSDPAGQRAASPESSQTARVASSSATIVMATSAPIRSLGAVATRAPRLATSSAALRVRLNTVSEWPASSRRGAIALPICPSPMNAICMDASDCDYLGVANLSDKSRNILDSGSRDLSLRLETGV